LFAEIFESRIFSGIKPLPGLLVDPIVAHHSVLVGMRARQQRCMTDAGIGRGMAVMVVAVPAAFVEKQLETAVAVEIVILDELLLREAVDHHTQHELRGRLARRCTRVLGESRRRQGYSGKQSECAKSAM